MQDQMREALLEKLLGGLFKVKEIRACNFKVAGQPGHPYTIGPKHIDYAAKHCGGIITKETTDALTCAAPGCFRYASEHTADMVAFLELTRNCSNKEASECLFQAKDFLTKENIDGVAFVETPEGYRIAPPEPTGETQ